jgi:hypothetical protein
MKNTIFIFIVFSVLILSCKKENNRIVNATYELDSVVESYLDTFGNEIHFRTYIAEPNFIINNIPADLLYNGTAGISFEERNDSILYQQILEAPNVHTQVFNNCYVTNGRFNSSYNKRLTSTYSDSYCYINKQHVNYNSTENLTSIVNTNDFFSSKDTFYGLENRQTQELSFLYAGNNISSIDLNCTLRNYSASDITNYNATGNITYSNHYLNQKDLIGLDVNDIILSSLLDLSLFSPISYNRSVKYLDINLSSYYLLSTSESLVLTKHATFNTNCDNLIEHMHFNYAPLTSNSFYLPFNSAPDIDITYEFDAVNANRIKQLNIQPSLPTIIISYPNNSYYTSLRQLRFTFYYKN